MSRARIGLKRRLGLYAVAAGLWGSGTLWLVAHYFWVRQGEYGPETSPGEPWALDVHGGFAMLSLWFLGLLWGIHILPGWRARRRRWTGATLFAGMLVLAVTGYLLYYLGDEDWRSRVSLIHWILGLASLLAFVGHRFQKTALETSATRRATRELEQKAEQASAYGAGHRLAE